MPRNCTELLKDAGSMSIFSTPTDPTGYIWLGITHILVILIPAFITVTIAYHLVTRLSEHPSKIIFKWICALCLICPCTYAILMDLSLILDRSLLGRCENEWEGAIYWFLHSMLETSLLWIFAFNPIMFYICIQRNTTNFSRVKIHAILAGIVMLAGLESSLWVFLTESHVDTRCRVRGSFCLVMFESPPVIVIALEYLRILIGVVPVLVSVPLFITLYWKKIKNSMRHFNRSLARSIMNVSISLLVGTFLFNLPTMLVHFATYHGIQRTFASLVTTYTLQLNFVLYPLLIITLHKDLRDSIAKKFRQLMRLGSTGVQPVHEDGEPLVIAQSFHFGAVGPHQRLPHPFANLPAHLWANQPQGNQQLQPRPQGNQPQGNQQPRPQGNQPQGNQQPRPQGNQQQPQQPRPQGNQQQPQQPHPQGNQQLQQPRPQGNQQQPQQPRPQGNQQLQQPRPQGNQPQGNQQPRPQGNQQQPQQPRPQGNQQPRPQGNHHQPRPQPQGDQQPRPQGNQQALQPRPQGNQQALQPRNQQQPQQPEDSATVDDTIPEPQPPEDQVMIQPLPEPHPPENTGSLPEAKGPEGMEKNEPPTEPHPPGRKYYRYPQLYPQGKIGTQERAWPEEELPGVILGQKLNFPKEAGEEIELQPVSWSR